MNANVSRLLNEQINKEFYSAYLYLDFANYYAAVGLDGFENWYRVQAQEERITPCCSISICRITARASTLRLSQSRSGNEATT